MNDVITPSPLDPTGVPTDIDGLTLNTEGASASELRYRTGRYSDRVARAELEHAHASWDEIRSSPDRYARWASFAADVIAIGAAWLPFAAVLGPDGSHRARGSAVVLLHEAGHILMALTLRDDFAEPCPASVLARIRTALRFLS